ncbi:MAG: hypothetical protein IPM52_04750 [Bacteroidetes bacterium]|nr:hypothetical protein [Bacteroidota bacterium]
MRVKHLIAILALSLGFGGCQVIQSVPFKSMGINEIGVVQHPVLAELEVLPTKITQTVEVKKAKILDEAKAIAMAQVLKDTKSDVLVEPKFEFKRKGAKLFVTVTAYPALYRSFRSMKPEDEYILEHMRFRRAEVAEGSVGAVPGKRKR